MSDPDIYAEEQQRIFRGPVWNYLCLEAEIADPGSYRTAYIGDTPVIAARDQDGKQLTIVELPMPHPVIFEGRRLPASYANFYIANGVVLAPVFNRPNDRIALNTLAQVFPKREIVPIYSGDFIWGLGAMHCMTQQQPA